MTGNGIIETEIRRRIGNLKDMVRGRNDEILHTVTTGPRTVAPWIHMHREHLRLLRLAVFLAGVMSLTAVVCFVTRPFPYNLQMLIMTTLFVGVAMFGLLVRNPGPGWHGLFGTGFLSMGIAVGSPTVLVCEGRLVVGAFDPLGNYAAFVFDYGSIERAAVGAGALKITFGQRSDGIEIANPVAEVPAMDDGIHTELAQAVRTINEKVAAARRPVSAG